MKLLAAKRLNEKKTLASSDVYKQTSNGFLISIAALEQPDLGVSVKHIKSKIIFGDMFIAVLSLPAAHWSKTCVLEFSLRKAGILI